MIHINKVSKNGIFEYFVKIQTNKGGQLAPVSKVC